MMKISGHFAWRRIALLLVTVLLSCLVQAQVAAPGGVRKIGTIKSINGNSLVLKTDAGPEVNVTVPDSARIVRLAPGQTDLRSAAPAELKDLQVGDRVLLSAAEADPLVASRVVVMKQGDVAQSQQQQLQDWQKRGA